MRSQTHTGDVTLSGIREDADIFMCNYCTQSFPGKHTYAKRKEPSLSEYTIIWYDYNKAVQVLGETRDFSPVHRGRVFDLMMLVQELFFLGRLCLKFKSYLFIHQLHMSYAEGSGSM